MNLKPRNKESANSATDGQAHKADLTDSVSHGKPKRSTGSVSRAKTHCATDSVSQRDTVCLTDSVSQDEPKYLADSACLTESVSQCDADRLTDSVSQANTHCVTDSVSHTSHVPKGPHIQTSDIVIFAMLGTVMFVSKLLLEWAPNVHLLGVLTMVYTLVYRRRALYPIYVFVLLEGIYNGFSTWWIPYLYLWTVLWGVTMLLPRSLPGKLDRLRPLMYMLVCGLHGLLYGTLYAPFQAIAYGLGLRGMLAWIAAGLPWDAVHAVSNFCCGILIMPLTKVLRKISGRSHRNTL